MLSKETTKLVNVLFKEFYNNGEASIDVCEYVVDAVLQHKIKEIEVDIEMRYNCGDDVPGLICAVEILLK